MTLRQQLGEHISACFTGLWVQSYEHDDALREIVQWGRSSEKAQDMGPVSDPQRPAGIHSED